MKNTILICITVLIVAVIGFFALNQYMDWKAEQDSIKRHEEWVNDITDSD